MQSKLRYLGFTRSFCHVSLTSCRPNSQKFDARIIIEGAHIGESKSYAETLVKKEGLTYVNGYDDPPIIAGAGTIGVEVCN